MNFVKKHYEKIILTAILVFFVISLVMQIQIILRTTIVTDEDLQFAKMDANYVEIDFKKPEYCVLEGLSKGSVWKKSTQRRKISDDNTQDNPSNRAFTDLTTAIKSARCPHCLGIIPDSCFPTVGSGLIYDCPLCQSPLKPPPKDIHGPKSDDFDEDGIPDEVEENVKLNKGDANDALMDLDNDSFSNLDEYNLDTSGKTINDRKLHPSLAKRLYVVKISRERIPLLVKKVIKRGENKNDWEIQVQYRGKKRKKTGFWKINQNVKIGNDDFIITDIIYKTQEIIDKRLNDTRKIDRSEIILKRPEQDELITAVVGEKVYEPKEIIVLREVYSKREKKFSVMTGAKFKIGNRALGIENFSVERIINPKRKIVKIVRDDAKSFILKSRRPETPSPETETRRKSEVPDFDDFEDIRRPKKKRRRF